MENGRILELEGDLKGMTVLGGDSGAKLGEVIDAIIDPKRGEVVGLAVKDDDGSHRVYRARDLRIGDDAVMVPRTEGIDAPTADRIDDGIPAAREIVGASVVTEDGRKLGEISEVCISTERPRVAYKVTGGTVDKLFGGGFFIPGDVPTAFAPDRPRFVVPSETEEKLAVRSADELFR